MKLSLHHLRSADEEFLLFLKKNGLENMPCELRLDKRFKQDALMLSVPGEDRTNHSQEESYGFFIDTPRNLLLLRADSVFFQNITQSGYGFSGSASGFLVGGV